MQIVEHFASIQGEGKYTGTPSIFVRFASCNLRCPGFGVQADGHTGCDTTRAVYPNASWQDTNSEQLIQIVKSYSHDKISHIVITGGEPLLHHTNEDFLAFVHYLRAHHYSVTIETNSTIFIDFEQYPIYKDIIFAMGLKLSNSGEKLSKRIKPKAISNIINNAKESFVKFVCDADISQCHNEIQSITKTLPKTDIYCMPMGVSSTELNQVSKHLVTMCMKYGYIFCDRLHIRLWGNEDAR